MRHKERLEKKKRSHHLVEERGGVRQIQHDFQEFFPTLGLMIGVPHTEFRYLP